jgi:hypothetical protein
MVAAHPLPFLDDDDLDVRPLDLSECAPEERAAIEAALERIACGTAQVVPHADVQRDLAEQRRRHEQQRGG